MMNMVLALGPSHWWARQTLTEKQLKCKGETQGREPGKKQWVGWPGSRRKTRRGDSLSEWKRPPGFLCPLVTGFAYAILPIGGWVTSTLTLNTKIRFVSHLKTEIIRPALLCWSKRYWEPGLVIYTFVCGKILVNEPMQPIHEGWSDQVAVTKDRLWREKQIYLMQ